MAYDDPTSADLLYGSDPRAAAAAYIQALRGQRDQGLALQALTGGYRAAPAIGAQIAQGAEKEVEQVPTMLGHRLTSEMHQRQLASLDAHRQAQEEQGWQRLGIQQGHLDAINKRLAQQGVRYNPNTGQFENIAPAARTGTASAPAPAPATQGPAAAALGVPPAPGQKAQPLAGKMLDKALKELGADFDPSGGRAGEFGKNQARVNAATRLLQLATDEQGNPKDLNPQQMPELSQALASLISGGGQGAQAQIEHLTPKTLRGNLQGTLQWLTGDPRGADQVEFVKNMIETAKRERDVAQQGIDQVRSQRGAKHQRVLLGNPEESRRLLQGFGWDLGPDGMPAMKGGGGSGPAPSGPKRIASDAEYDALPSGADFIGPDGKHRRKP